MELYTLDRNFIETALIEDYTSLLWTERYDAYGDFTLRVSNRSSSLPFLRTGQFLYNTESFLLMEIMTVSREISNNSTVKITGRSIEAWLLDRIVMPNHEDGVYVTSGIPSRVIAELVNSICVDAEGFGGPRDVFPSLDRTYEQNLGTHQEYEFAPSPLYDVVQEIAQGDNFGFRTVFDRDTRTMRFGTYQGIDRSDQLVFSDTIGNVNKIEYLRSRENYKNTAYVYHRDLSRSYIVYRSVGTQNARGIERQVMLVDASNIKNPREWSMRRAGRNALRQQGYLTLVSTDIHPGHARYGNEYGMGALVTVDIDGESEKLRVVENTLAIENGGATSTTTLDQI